VAEATGDGFVVGGELLVSECACGVGDECGFGDVEGVEEEKLGVAAGGVGDVGVGAEALGGGLDGFVGGHGVAGCQLQVAG
jgi:hypothetical protein